MPDRRSYLDCNATAPLRPEARAAMIEVLDRVGNPSSVHGEGRWARRVVEEAREAIALLAGCSPSEVVFTSGGTEANALAMTGGGRIRRIASAIEHPSVLAHATETVPAGADGVADIARLAAAATAAGEGGLVSLMLANNETGVIQQVGELATAVRGSGVLIHTDAVQAPGRIDFSFNDLSVDLMTLSGHKLGGPAGVGALVVRDGVALSPLLAGGGQEGRRRAGTENLAGIVGFAAAARAVLRHGREEATRMAALRDRLEAAIRRAAPGAVVHGAGAARLPNTSCIGLAGMAAETQVMALDLAGVAVSAGSACSSGKVAASHVLAAMAVPPEAAGTAIRVSVGWSTTEADVDRFVEAWCGMAARRSAA